MTSEQDRDLECDLDSKAASATESDARTHKERRRNTIYVLKYIQIGKRAKPHGCVFTSRPFMPGVSVELVLG